MKKIFLKWTITVLLAALMFAGSNSENDTNYFSENPEEEIRDLWDQFIENWEAENAAECASLYHQDSLNIPNELEINSGRLNIEEFYRFLFENNDPAGYVHQTESLSFSGQTAVEYATFQAEWVNSEGDEWTYHARALVHWVLDENEEWKIKTFLFNSPPIQ